MKGLTRIDRYVAAELTRGWALAAGILLALFSLIAFIEELDDVGDGGYGALDALRFVVLTTPARVLRLLPLVTLFGGALALWQLARRSELVVLRAAGMNLPRLALATALPSLVLVVSIPLAYEFVAPVLHAEAVGGRDEARGRTDVMARDGFWSRNGDTLVEVGQLAHGRVPTDVRIYRLGADSAIESVKLAGSANPRENGDWRLVDARRRGYQPSRVAITRVTGDLWRPWWVDARHLVIPPVDSLSFTDLRGYIAYLQRTGQPTRRWELAYWRMWLTPVAALLTGLLAIPIALTRARDAEFHHASVALGSGLVYYLGDQIVANAGVVAGLPPLVVALVPPLVLALVIILIARRL